MSKITSEELVTFLTGSLEEDQSLESALESAKETEEFVNMLEESIEHDALVDLYASLYQALSACLRLGIIIGNPVHTAESFIHVALETGYKLHTLLNETESTRE